MAAIADAAAAAPPADAWAVGLAGRDVVGEFTRDVSRDDAHVPSTLAASSKSNSRSLRPSPIGSAAIIWKPKCTDKVGDCGCTSPRRRVCVVTRGLTGCLNQNRDKLQKFTTIGQCDDSSVRLVHACIET
eukprot:m.162355 g.162355  ORF g.162355 m.162355 type:complete len:130 (-) comp12179_c0_seq1:3-392(-)